MPKKVILQLAMTVDGYIADENGSVDWIDQTVGFDLDWGYEQFMAGIDTIVMGANSYHDALKLSSTFPYAEKENYIMTHQAQPDLPKRHFVNSDVVELVQQLRQASGKAIWIFGGGSVIQPLIEADLIDEYQLFTAPVILGRGTPLFGHRTRPLLLQLKTTTVFGPGVMVTYERKQIKAPD
ncbi:dihydrofolate reductase family protein [Loigolactobacillus zhaoyuanensis]|uniref:Dihydrofolate reductase family protein n=1 Tax=Loigolactobacillus zhaoyuanensis TaxID=2486017 RepID=A0ABW8UEG1_9LACO|nr:dihydrofolate reductase family protein [Loigolactobacillus zhaoyuanensis]